MDNDATLATVISATQDSVKENLDATLTEAATEEADSTQSSLGVAMANAAEFAASALDEAAVDASLGAEGAAGHAEFVEQAKKRSAGRDMSRKPSSIKASATSSATCTKLAVKNIAFEATRKELRELFGSFGPLKSVRLPRKFDGAHRGFAFVEFTTKHDSQTAFDALSSTHLYGRRLVIEWAESTQELDAARAKAMKDMLMVTGGN